MLAGRIAAVPAGAASPRTGRLKTGRPRPIALSADRRVEWRVFTVPAVNACIMAKVGTGVLGYALEQWAPYYFVDVLGVPPLRLA